MSSRQKMGDRDAAATAALLEHQGAAGRLARRRERARRAMASCKEFGELSSQSLEVRPGLWRRVRVFLHHRLCGPCRTSDRNFRMLRDAVRRAGLSSAADCDGLADCTKKRMRSVIEAALAASGDAAGGANTAAGGANTSASTSGPRRDG